MARAAAERPRPRADRDRRRNLRSPVFELTSSRSPNVARCATLNAFDLDGSLDAFFANWLTGAGYTSERQLMKGDRKGVFSDISGEAGLTDAIAMRGACGVTACDVDCDGMPEISGWPGSFETKARLYVRAAPGPFLARN